MLIEVVHQIAKQKANVDGRDRRFDVTLLINGLPIVQMELKQVSAKDGVFQAYNQIKKYAEEGMFRNNIFRQMQIDWIDEQKNFKLFRDKIPTSFIVKNNHTPEIRFPGYTGDWNQRKLDLIVDRVKSYSLSRDVETSEYTGYKYIHYGDIHTKVADLIDESSNLPSIKAGNYELLEKGDLVLADASEDYQGIATPAVITIDTPYKLVSGLHTIALRPKQVDSLFLYYLINSPTFKKYGYKTGTGMKVFGISVTNLLKFEGMFPLLEEQIKIGVFLKQLDDTIALHQQELTTFKQTKQGFLQKMFPKEGESVPEVRFPGFTGEWEQRNISEIGNISAGGDIDRSKLIDGGKFPVLANALTNDGIVGYYNNYKSVAPAVTITGRGDVGHAKARHVNFTAIVRLLVLKPFDDFNVDFLESAINNTNILVESTGVPQLTAPQLGNYKVSFPTIEEQNKIGNFFRQLDEIIAVHQRELDACKC